MLKLVPRPPSNLWVSIPLIALLLLVPLAVVTVAQDHQGGYAPADVAAGARLYNTLCASCHSPTGAGVGGIDLRRGPTPRASTDAALSAIITTGIPGSGMPAFKLDPADVRSLVAFIRSGLDANATAPPGPSPGNPSRGQTLFESQGNCLSCHRVSGKGQDSGPELTEIGRARTPAALQRSLLDPTGSMLPINRPVRAVTRDGSFVKGRRLNEDTYTVQIMTDGGRLVSLVKSELREWSVDATSPMPSYKESLTPEEMADIVAYLSSLRGPRP